MADEDDWVVLGGETEEISERFAEALPAAPRTLADEGGPSRCGGGRAVADIYIQAKSSNYGDKVVDRNWLRRLPRPEARVRLNGSTTPIAACLRPVNGSLKASRYLNGPDRPVEPSAD